LTAQQSGGQTSFASGKDAHFPQGNWELNQEIDHFEDAPYEKGAGSAYKFIMRAGNKLLKALQKSIHAIE